MIKKVILIFVIIFLSYLSSAIGKEALSGQIGSLKSDGNALYAIVYSNKNTNLKQLHPSKNSVRLPSLKGFRYYMHLTEKGILVLNGNKLSLFSRKLTLLDTYMLPKSKSDFEFVRISRVENFVIVSDYNSASFLFDGNNLIKLENSIHINKFKIGWSNSQIRINGKLIGEKVESFYLLLRSFFLLGNNKIIIGKKVYDDLGNIIAELPIRYYVYDVVEIEDRFFILSPSKILYLNCDMQIILNKNAIYPYFLGFFKKEILFKLDNFNLALISIANGQIGIHKFEKKKIGSIALIGDIIHYTLKNALSILNKVDIGEIL
jgi:hypothetical protein